jgi:hypothetical protein
MQVNCQRHSPAASSPTEGDPGILGWDGRIAQYQTGDCAVEHNLVPLTVIGTRLPFCASRGIGKGKVHPRTGHEGPEGEGREEV